MKTCTKCDQIKDTGEFYKESSTKDGLTFWCRSCMTTSSTAWNKANSEKVRARKRAWYKANSDKVNTSARAWFKANSDKAKAGWKAWKKANRGRRRAHDAKRNAQKLEATPPWLSKSQLLEIQSIYVNCPKGYQVDHIIPLQGREVRGLHVPWNLQYLLACDNIKKGNRI